MSNSCLRRAWQPMKKERQSLRRRKLPSSLPFLRASRGRKNCKFRHERLKNSTDKTPHYSLIESPPGVGSEKKTLSVPKWDGDLFFSPRRGRKPALKILERDTRYTKDIRRKESWVGGRLVGLDLEDWLRAAAEGMRRRVLSQVYILLSAAQRPIRTTETFAGHHIGKQRDTHQGVETSEAK